MVILPRSPRINGAPGQTELFSADFNIADNISRLADESRFMDFRRFSVRLLIMSASSARVYQEEELTLVYIIIFHR